MFFIPAIGADKRARASLYRASRLAQKKITPVEQPTIVRRSDDAARPAA